MRKSIKDWLSSFSFVLPGVSQYLNGDNKRGTALASTAVVGLLLYRFGGVSWSDIGLTMLFLAVAVNLLDMVFQPIFYTLDEIHESLQRIALSLERIAPQLELIAAGLSRMDRMLPESEYVIRLGSGELKLLPAPKRLLMLPPPEKRILLGAVEKRANARKESV